MKKKNDGDESAQSVKELKDGLRLEIEKYLVDHGCTTRIAMTMIPMALNDIFASIAKIEEVSFDEVVGTFVKAFGAWDYLKTMKEG